MVQLPQASQQQSSHRGIDQTSGPLCHGGGVSNLAISASLSPRSTSTTKQHLASVAANDCLQPTTQRRGCPHRCSSEAGFRARQSTHLPQWQFG